MSADKPGVPPGFVIRFMIRLPNAAQSVPMKYPSVADGSSFWTPCGVSIPTAPLEPERPAVVPYCHTVKVNDPARRFVLLTQYKALPLFTVCVALSKILAPI